VTVNHESEKIQKKAVVTYFKALFRNLPRGIKDTNESHQNYSFPNRDSSWVPLNKRKHITDGENCIGNVVVV
jgi:hypothetical protein